MIKELALIFQIPILMGGWNGHPPILLNNSVEETDSSVLGSQVIEIDDADVDRKTLYKWANGTNNEGQVNALLKEENYYKLTGSSDSLYCQYWKYEQVQEYYDDDSSSGGYYIYADDITECCMIEIFYIKATYGYGINWTSLTSSYDSEYHEDNYVELSYSQNMYISTYDMSAWLDYTIGSNYDIVPSMYNLMMNSNKWNTLFEGVSATWGSTNSQDGYEYYTSQNEIYLMQYTYGLSFDAYEIEQQSTIIYDLFATESVKIGVDVWNTGATTTSDDYATDIENGNFISVWGLMLNIITLPFAFISQAVNITLWPGTVASVNIGTLVMSILGAIILIFMIKLIVSKFK